MPVKLLKKKVYDISVLHTHGRLTPGWDGAASTRLSAHGSIAGGAGPALPGWTGVRGVGLPHASVLHPGQLCPFSPRQTARGGLEPHVLWHGTYPGVTGSGSILQRNSSHGPRALLFLGDLMYVNREDLSGQEWNWPPWPTPHCWQPANPQHETLRGTYTKPWV